MINEFYKDILSNRDEIEKSMKYLYKESTSYKLLKVVLKKLNKSIEKYEKEMK